MSPRAADARASEPQPSPGDAAGANGSGASGGEPTFVERDVVTWDALEVLVKRLAEQVGRGHDVLLAITRGGLVPAGMLAYLLGQRDILVAAVAFYDDHGQPGEQPAFLQFPSDPLLHGKRVLIIDEVWDTGTTIEAVVERVRLAGGTPTTAVLHYKPDRSKVDSVPDHHVVSTDAWVVYPFKYGR
jgi:uncharacterized protein